ncbi:MAG: hypothetical protein E6J90_10615 [Deltaproteobacteria bacterium]|nr:MAG: hypothetical protein E6J90_10615 [Deltaproteobacteria bacterium]
MFLQGMGTFCRSGACPIGQYMALSTGTSFTQWTWSLPTTDWSPYNIELADVNGDHSVDLLPQGACSMCYPRPCLVGQYLGRRYPRARRASAGAHRREPDDHRTAHCARLSRRARRGALAGQRARAAQPPRAVRRVRERRLPNAPAAPHPSTTIDATLPYEIARRQALDAFERST